MEWAKQVRVRCRHAGRAVIRWMNCQSADWPTCRCRLADTPSSSATCSPGGLVCCRAGDIDRHFAFWEAGVAAGLTDGPGLAHVVYRMDGAPLGGGWIEERANGMGRTHLVVDRPGDGPAAEIIVDLTSDPASQRLRRILDSDATGHRWQPARNALVAASAPLVPGQQELIAVERLVLERIGPDADGTAPIAAGVCEEISKHAGKLRHELAIDAPQAAGLLLAAQVPIACAAQHPGNTALAELIRRRYLSAIPEVLLVSRRQPGAGPGCGGSQHLVR
jgi:hypothetical protein